MICMHEERNSNTHVDKVKHTRFKVRYENTIKKPQSRHASPSCWIALERSLGLEEVSCEKSMVGIFSVSCNMESSGFLRLM